MSYKEFRIVITTLGFYRSMDLTDRTSVYTVKLVLNLYVRVTHEIANFFPFCETVDEFLNL